MTSTSEKLDKILPKILAVKRNLKSVAKTSNNPYFKSKYADLNSHLEALEDLLHEQGLVVMQPTNSDGLSNIATTRVYDTESGQFIESSLCVALEKPDMQKLGAGVTYARRYALSALFAMKAEDDDFESGLGRGKTAPKAWSRTNQQQANAEEAPISVPVDVNATINPVSTGFQTKTSKRRL